MADSEKYRLAECRLRDFLRSHKRRVTPERLEVLSKALGFRRPFSVSELASALGEDSPRMSLSTLYEGMSVLVEAGIFRKLMFDNSEARYEPEEADHFHLVCTGCGKVRSVADPQLAQHISGRRFEAFAPVYFTMTFYGICSACARKARKKISAAAPKNKKRQKI